MVSYAFMPPSYAHGKICYIQIPATDARRSSDFYAKVFGWEIQERGDGSITFHDGVEVSGGWVTGAPPAAEPGFMIYVMVDSVAASCEAVVANGGAIIQPLDPDARELTARFRDPAGNVLGLYQQRA